MVIPVKKATVGSIPIGTGVVETGNYSTDGFILVDFPTTADAIVHGVIWESVPTDTNMGMMLQVGLSNTQVTLGSSGVTVQDKLNIQGNTGVWQTAPVNSNNIYYMALETKAAGMNCWVAPLASSNNLRVGILQSAEGHVTTNLTTTSSTLSDMTGASASFTIQAGSKVEINASYSTSTTSLLGATNTIVLVIDGVVDSGSGATFAGIKALRLIMG